MRRGINESRTRRIDIRRISIPTDQLVHAIAGCDRTFFTVRDYACAGIGPWNLAFPHGLGRLCEFVASADVRRSEAPEVIRCRSRYAFICRICHVVGFRDASLAPIKTEIEGRPSRIEMIAAVPNHQANFDNGQHLQQEFDKHAHVLSPGARADGTGHVQPTATERSKRSVEELMTAGGKRIMLRLTPEAHDALKIKMARTGATQETATINQLLIACAKK